MKVPNTENYPDIFCLGRDTNFMFCLTVDQIRKV